MASAKNFRAVLIKDDSTEATSIAIPFDVSVVFGSRGRVAVCGTLNGIAFRSSIFPYDGVHFLIVNRPLRELAGLKAGDEVEVYLERDDDPREITLPADLACALSACPEALDAWNNLSYTRRKEMVGAVEEAKKPETRARRISKAVSDTLARVKSRAGK